MDPSQGEAVSTLALAVAVFSSRKRLAVSETNWLRPIMLSMIRQLLQNLQNFQELPAQMASGYRYH